MTIRLLLSFLLLISTAAARADEASAPVSDTSVEDAVTEMSEEDQYLLWAMNLWSSMNRQTGEIKLPGAGAILQVPENFYYLNPEDAEKVLVDVWGNPPGQNTLGMIFPADVTPFEENSWAVTIEYEQDGYVSDDDADSLDYQDLLKQMKEDTAAASEERVAMGYETLELVGWASPPFYDKGTHKLHWAKELKFGDAEENTLNYNIRVLGRKGILVLNFIAGMGQKEVIEQNLDAVLAMAEFDQGSRYADFNPDIDEVAAYGLGALVAGKVLAKTGMLAIILVFLKKFGVYILIGLGFLARKLFSRSKPKA